MKVNGDEFLKNIEKEQARSNPTPAPHSQEEIDSYYNNYNENTSTSLNSELDDIRLTDNKSNKQKYILFGLSLVLLFLITIVTLRLLSDDTETKNNFTDNNLIEEKKYDFAQVEKKPNVQNKLDINEIEQAEENIKIKSNEEEKINKVAESDLFEMENKKTVLTKEETIVEEIIPNNTTQANEQIIKEIKTDKIVKKEIIVEEKPVIKSVNGIYIQVGAFTKTPDKKLLNKIKANNYNYIVHKMNVKGKMYNKVLIGKYSSRSVAKKDLSTIKQTFNKYAYILEVK